MDCTYSLEALVCRKKSLNARTIELVLYDHTLAIQLVSFYSVHCFSTGYGECDGRCVIELFTLNLLVYDLSPDAAWPPLTFDWFAVPGYCSCKNAMTTVSSELFQAKLSPSSFDSAQP